MSSDRAQKQATSKLRLYLAALLAGAMPSAGAIAQPSIEIDKDSPSNYVIDTSPNPTAEPKNCPPSALSQLRRHRIQRGETIEKIAKRYNLTPATLMAMNPNISNGSAPAGAEIIVSPYDGIRVAVPAGQTWKDVANAYGIRADVLFELNGCQTAPQVVFVPGTNWIATRPTTSNNTAIASYPLPATAKIALGYGWRAIAATNQINMHSGADLLADAGTSVLAMGDGTVAYAGDRDSYGNLVVINHQWGQQTRYAHLGTINASAGQTVKAGDRIGTVGTTGKPDIDRPHLHLEVRYNSSLGWVAEDPQPYLRRLAISTNKR